VGLYADDKHSTRLVAFEKVYEGVSIIHHVRLTNDLVKVGLEEVQDVNADILLPTSKVQLVRQVVGFFIARLRHLMNPVLHEVFT